MLTKILIVDASEDFRGILAEELNSEYHVQVCGDGQQALEQLRSSPVDFLVLDLMLPQVDGLTVLQTAKKEHLLPPTLVTCVRYSDYTIAALEDLDIAYMIQKPCQLSALVSRIQDMAGQAAPPLLLHPTAQSAITSALLALGMSTNRKGFRYCRRAIELLMENPNGQITKEIYPAIGKEFGVEPESVEKNIRDAITAAWLQRNDAAWRRYFPTAPNGQIPRPTNGVFLTRLQEAISLPSAMAR